MEACKRAGGASVRAEAGGSLRRRCGGGGRGDQIRWPLAGSRPAWSGESRGGGRTLVEKREGEKEEEEGEKEEER